MKLLPEAVGVVEEAEEGEAEGEEEQKADSKEKCNKN